MAFKLTYEQIVSTALENVKTVINKYDTNNPEVFIQVYLNFESMGPVATINFAFSQYSDNPTMVRIELWYARNDNQYVLIYSAMDKDLESDHHSHDLENLDDAYQYFEKAIQLFELNEIES